ncbi:hypothetical protein WP50_14840 [Lactiplantibacillus plantarum]|nr:hypothetical protein WP50_14840 [Lactiplantibacillus plantarum]
MSVKLIAIDMDGTLLNEHSELNPSDLVRAITGKVSGDQRFFFPKEMLSKNAENDLFKPIYQEFQQYILNDRLVVPH